MPRFHYKTVGSGGDIVEGAVDAPNRAAAVEQLRGEGHVPIRVSEVNDHGNLDWLFRELRPWRNPSPGDVIVVTRELATMVHAGLALDRALNLAAELAPNQPQRRFAQAILRAVRGGASLADAMATRGDVVPPFYIGMVRAGEAGGTLDSVLLRLADSLESTQSMRESLRSALYYPLIVLMVAGLTLVVLLTGVIPEFKPLFEDTGRAMPTSLALLILIGDVLRSWWWVLVLLAIGFVSGLRYHNRLPRGRVRWDGWIQRLPMLGDLLVKIEIARFTHTLGMLLTNGVATLQALSISIGAIENRAVARAIDGIVSRVRRGEGLAVPLAETGVFPKLAAQLVAVGEESGQLEAMLLRIASIYEEEIKRKLQRLLALLVPVVTLGLGALVAGIVGSMLTAILSTYDLSSY